MRAADDIEAEPKFGQGPPPAGGWKRDMTEDPDYSPAYQDEYQRLWHEAVARAEAAEKERDEALRGILAGTAARDLGRRNVELQAIIEQVVRRAEAAEKERDEERRIAYSMFLDAQSESRKLHESLAREAALREALTPFLASPRWLTIGRNQNAEVRVSASKYELARAVLAASPEGGS